MRTPRASAVIVALSTFVAVATVASVVSQLTPVDRAGAVIPQGPINISAPPSDPSADPEVTPSSTTAPDIDGTTDTGGATGSTNEGTTVVQPAPAVAVDPSPASPPAAPSAPGNSGEAPGQTGTSGNNSNAPGQSNKP